MALIYPTSDSGNDVMTTSTSNGVRQEFIFAPGFSNLLLVPKSFSFPGPFTCSKSGSLGC